MLSSGISRRDLGSPGAYPAIPLPHQQTCGTAALSRGPVPESERAGKAGRLYSSHFVFTSPTMLMVIRSW